VAGSPALVRWIERARSPAVPAGEQTALIPRLSSRVTAWSAALVRAARTSWSWRRGDGCGAPG